MQRQWFHLVKNVSIRLDRRYRFTAHCIDISNRNISNWFSKISKISNYENYNGWYETKPAKRDQESIHLRSVFILKHFPSIEQEVEITISIFFFYFNLKHDSSWCEDAASQWCIISEWEHEVAAQFSSDLADAITSVRHCQEVTGLVNGNQLRLLKATWSRQGFVKHFLWSRSAPMNCVSRKKKFLTKKKTSVIFPNVPIPSSNTVALCSLIYIIWTTCRMHVPNLTKYHSRIVFFFFFLVFFFFQVLKLMHKQNIGRVQVNNNNKKRRTMTTMAVERGDCELCIIAFSWATKHKSSIMEALLKTLLRTRPRNRRIERKGRRKKEERKNKRKMKESSGSLEFSFWVEFRATKVCV